MTISPIQKIRWQILSIAIVGSVSFACYLAYNFFVAHSNEQRIEDIRLVKYPVIEHVRRMESDLRAIHNMLTNAIGLGDPFLIDDSQALADNFKTRAEEVIRLDKSLTSEVNAIRTSFVAYYEQAVILSRTLVDSPDSLLEKKQTDVQIMNNLYNINREQIKTFLGDQLERYSRSLFLADHSMKQANKWGVILGFITIAILIGLALTITVTVVAAVNRSDRLKEEFLATISHELRTPMNGIMGAIALLKGTELSDGQKKLVDAATTSSSDMLVAVNDILEFSDIISNDFSTQEIRFTFKTLLENLLDKYEKEATKKGLRFVAPEPSSDITFNGECNRIAHVLSHLLDNAIKFTPKGQITFSYSSEPRGADTHLLKFEITDTGPGVPEQFISEMFKPFKQLDGSFTRAHGGLGIGLSMCKRIADALKGSLNFKNRQEGGAVASFSIPVKESMEPLKEAPSPAEIRAHRDEQKVVQLKLPKQLNVLVAEDNKVNQMIIKGYLNKLGCNVVTANNGKEAVEKLEDLDIDVILMDCQMPVLDGFQATELIRDMPSGKAQTPIIAVTANALESDRMRCFDAGMDAYLSKPVDLVNLRRVVHEVAIDGKKSHKEQLNPL